MNSSWPKWRPFVRDLLLTAFFALLSQTLAQIRFSIPALDLGTSSFNEIGILIGVFYLRHWAFAVAVAILASIGADARIVWLSMIAHALAAGVAWHANRWIRKKFTGIYPAALAWSVFVFLYYQALLLPFMLVFHRTMEANPMPVLDYSLLALTSLFPEISMTMIITFIYHSFLSELNRRRRTEKDLRESEARYRIVAEQTGQLIYDLDIKTGVNTWAGAIKANTGFTPEEFATVDVKEWELMIHPDDRTMAGQLLESVMKTGERYHVEYRFRKKDGRYIHVEDNGVFLRNEAGDVYRMLGTMINIDERKRAEEDLLSETSFSDFLINSLPGVFYLIDSKGKFRRWNKNLETVTGYSAEEITQLSATSFYRPQDVAQAERVIAEVFEKGHAVIESDVVVKDGRVIPYYMTGFRLDTRGESFLIGVGFDVSDRRQAEKALRESIERFELVAKTTNDAVWDWNAETDTAWWNDALYDLFGYERSVTKPALNSWIEKVHPEDRDAVRFRFDDARYRGKNGWGDEFRFLMKDGTYGTIYERAFVIRDPQGKPIRMLGAMMDVTSRKKLEHNLIQAQKTESLGRVAGGIAHDINNMLAVMLPTAEMLADQADDPVTVKKFAEVISSSARRASDIVKQLLVFARQTPASKALMNVNDLVRETQKMLDRILGKNIHTILDLENEIPFIEADSTQIQQIIINLCVNARDAMNDWGTINIATTMSEIGATDARIHGVEPGLYVELRIADTGTGIPPELLSKIFDPFFSTKEIGKGTGLGLAVVKTIVTGHGGFIDVQSETGKGTLMRIVLPVSRKQPPALSQTTSSRYVQGSGTILLVDDEEPILEMGQMLLAALGYTAQAASTGLKAVETFRSGRFELVILDIQMPGIDGVETLKRLREIRPDVKFIFSTGYMSVEQLNDLTENYPDRIVYKPYSIEQLSHTIKKVLES